ncbi:hypothetical protein PVAP13_6KG093424 [Panicum virgatum]|uniref:ATP synthase subunit epsilon, mitochondrial n=1 Tax=Panicum virgatum TaxID=38727 RepID=A0A8T0RC50_PANVG|nr:hypothetical protein PVAP13_6KG093424 [Panicum virgatum]
MSATKAAVPFWRAAGMTYIGYSNICAKLVRRCLKEPAASWSISPSPSGLTETRRSPLSAKILINKDLVSQ